jgi:hypothetical protein
MFDDLAGKASMSSSAKKMEQVDLELQLMGATLPRSMVRKKGVSGSAS